MAKSRTKRCRSISISQAIWVSTSCWSSSLPVPRAAALRFGPTRGSRWRSRRENLVDGSEITGRQLQVHRIDVLVDLRRMLRADDDAADRVVRQNPRQRELAHGRSESV